MLAQHESHQEVEAAISNSKCPPRLGEDSERVLKELLGYSDEEIEALRNDRVIGEAP